MAGAVALIRALLLSATIAGGSSRSEFILQIVQLGILFAVTLVLAGIAWWLVAKLHQSRRQLEQLAVRDSLTGLFNRRYFRETYAREVQRAQRTGAPFSVVMLDFDEFKRVNDTRGHLAGDAVLVSFANLLRGSMRSVDILARYGGDEFVILMPSTTPENARTALIRLHRNRATWHPAEAGDVGLEISVGVATWDGTTEVLEQADTDMYLHKRGSKQADGAGTRLLERPE